MFKWFSTIFSLGTLTFSISTCRKKIKAVVLYPFWFIQVEVVAYYYACNTFSILTRSRKKIRSCSISFLVHPGRSPVIQLCLSASRIYNTFSISTRRKKDILSFRGTKSM